MTIATLFLQVHSPVQIGVLPDQTPLSEHVLVSSPTSIWPVSQEYVAIELYVVLVHTTTPSPGLTRHLQSITKK